MAFHLPAPRVAARAAHPVEHEFANVVVKHLLRGRFARVSELRRGDAQRFDRLPNEVRIVANDWTGTGRGTQAGRQTLQRFLQLQSPTTLP